MDLALSREVKRQGQRHRAIHFGIVFFNKQELRDQYFEFLKFKKCFLLKLLLKMKNIKNKGIRSSKHFGYFIKFSMKT